MGDNHDDMIRAINTPVAELFKMVSGESGGTARQADDGERFTREDDLHERIRSCPAEDGAAAVTLPLRDMKDYVSLFPRVYESPLTYSNDKEEEWLEVNGRNVALRHALELCEAGYLDMCFRVKYRKHPVRLRRDIQARWEHSLRKARTFYGYDFYSAFCDDVRRLCQQESTDDISDACLEVFLLKTKKAFRENINQYWMDAGQYDTATAKNLPLDSFMKTINALYSGSDLPVKRLSSMIKRAYTCQKERFDDPRFRRYATNHPGLKHFRSCVLKSLYDTPPEPPRDKRWEQLLDDVQNKFRDFLITEKAIADDSPALLDGQYPVPEAFIQKYPNPIKRMEPLEAGYWDAMNQFLGGFLVGRYRHQIYDREFVGVDWEIRQTEKCEEIYAENVSSKVPQTKAVPKPKITYPSLENEKVWGYILARCKPLPKLGQSSLGNWIRSQDIGKPSVKSLAAMRNSEKADSRVCSEDSEGASGTLKRDTTGRIVFCPEDSNIALYWYETLNTKQARDFWEKLLAECGNTQRDKK